MGMDPRIKAMLARKEMVETMEIPQMLVGKGERRRLRRCLRNVRKRFEETGRELHDMIESGKTPRDFADDNRESNEVLARTFEISIANNGRHM